MSFQLQDSNNADVLLDSGLNLFNIIVNLCFKLHYKVLLKSGNYIVYPLKWTSDLDFSKEDLSGQKLSVILPTHALNYCVQK